MVGKNDYQSDSINTNFNENMNYKSDTNNYIIEKNDYKSDLVNNNLVENKTKIIQNIIDNLIEGFDSNDIDNGNDKKIVEKNMAIILTST